MIIEDLDVLFSGPDAIDVTVGTSSFKGFLDMPDEIIGNGMNISTEYVLTVKTSDVSSVSEEDVIIIAGLSYEVRRNLKFEDGLLSKLHLSKEDS